jgi:MFS family permease
MRKSADGLISSLTSVMIPNATKGRIFFGWKVVAAAFTITFFSAGIDIHGPAVFLQVLHAEHGWSISLISSAITTHFCVSALTVAFLSNAYSRFGLSATTRFGVAATALGVLGWAVAASPWSLFGAAILTGAGWATASAAAINVMVVPWFERRRPTALAHALNGMSIAGILFVPLWMGLISHIGFAAAAAAIGMTTLIVTWPLAGRYLRQTPATMGLAPDGDPVPDTT